MAGRLKVICGIGRKTAALGLVLGLAVAVGGLWLAVRDKGDFEESRQERVRTIVAERAKVRSALGGVHERMAKLTTDIAAEQERIRLTGGIIRQLKELDSTWDKLTGDAQQKANTERREKLETQLAEARAKVPEQQAEYIRTGWERDGLEIELSKLEGQMKAEEGKSKVGHFLALAWNSRVGGMSVKGWVIGLVALYVGVRVAGEARREGKTGRQEGAAE